MIEWNCGMCRHYDAERAIKGSPCELCVENPYATGMYRTIPFLTDFMGMVGATNMTLSEEAGVSVVSISMARNGRKLLKLFSAVSIMLALQTRTFVRGKYPMTWSDKKRLTYYQHNDTKEPQRHDETRHNDKKETV